MKSIPLKRLLNELLEFDHLEGTELQQNLVSWLDKNISYYNWTGFYFMNEEKQQLEIGPYVGAFTDHSIIPYGKGICGQVALSGKTFEVPDVNAQDNYLACSLATKSEIVVPIYANDKLIGQIDIDSHQLDPFTTEDHELLERVAEFVANRLYTCILIASTGSNLEAIQAGINPDMSQIATLSTRPTTMFLVLKKISNSNILAAANAPTYTRNRPAAPPIRQSTILSVKN